LYRNVFGNCPPPSPQKYNGLSIGNCVFRKSAVGKYLIKIKRPVMVSRRIHLREYPCKLGRHQVTLKIREVQLE